MVYAQPRDPNSASVPAPAKLTEEGDLIALTFSISCIDEITTMKIANLPAELTSSSSKKQIHQTLLGLS